MSLMPAYLVTTKNLAPFFEAVQSARAPERFTTRFLTDLDFTSSNDRQFIGLLKGLGFVDDTGSPTQRYYDYLDSSQSRRVLAGAIREAYDDLFAINQRANDLSVDDVKGKFKSLTQGQKSENVYNLMANTFKALTGLADWTPTSAAAQSKVPLTSDDKDVDPILNTNGQKEQTQANHVHRERELELHYNIQVILPECSERRARLLLGNTSRVRARLEAPEGTSRSCCGSTDPRRRRSVFLFFDVVTEVDVRRPLHAGPGHRFVQRG